MGTPIHRLVYGSKLTLTYVNILCYYHLLKVKEVILKGDGQIPKCSFCGDGVVKPNIVFFREDLPARFKELLEPDCSECDLLIIMGTSLTVQPFNSITHRVKETTPRLLVSNSTMYSESYSN